MLQKIVLVIAVASAIIGGILWIEHGFSTPDNLETYYSSNQEEWEEFKTLEEAKAIDNATITLSVEANTIIYRYDYDDSLTTTEAQEESEKLIDNTDVDNDIVTTIQDIEGNTGIVGVTIQKEFYNSDGDYINGELYSI